MISKAALIGCKDGPWIPTHSLVQPRLRTQGEEGTIFRVDYEGGTYFNVGLGEHPIDKGGFVKVSVLEGNHESALCHILADRRG